MLHTHEIDDIADRFRLWLRETDEELKDPQVVAVAEQIVQHAATPTESDTSVGLLQLVETLTAMRHDHKLHTKSLRQLHDGMQDSQAHMDHATRGLETARSDIQQTIEKATSSATESVLIALLDVDEALRQATAETATHDSSDTDSRHAMEQVFQELPKWKQFFVRGIWDRLRERVSADNPSATECGEDQGTLEGLGLLQSRVRRALADAGVAPLTCVGNKVDPRTMCVVDVVQNDQLPPETVVDELRVGYTWHGKIIRIAEVRATKSKGSQPVQS